MLTKVTAYSQWVGFDPLVLNILNRPETDLFEVRNIDGLGAVKANVNTTPFGSIDGESFSGTSVGKRNIVLTLGLNPDWNDWTVSRLRRLLDKTFMPQQSIRLVFESMEFSPVEISGWIESNEPNMFSKDPEQQISIICPDLYFSSVDPIVITGQTIQDPLEIDYPGNVETGINVEVVHHSGTDPIHLAIETSALDLYAYQGFFIDDSVALVSPTKKLVMNSIPGDKYIHQVTIADNTFISMLEKVETISAWQTLRPGINQFAVITDIAGTQDWTLTYNERYGSL